MKEREAITRINQRLRSCNLKLKRSRRGKKRAELGRFHIIGLYAGETEQPWNVVMRDARLLSFIDGPIEQERWALARPAKNRVQALLDQHNGCFDCAARAYTHTPEADLGRVIYHVDGVLTEHDAKVWILRHVAA